MATVVGQSRRQVEVILRQPPLYWGGAALILLALQLANGTMPLFALLVFVFVVLTCTTVTLLGGVVTIPGASVLYLALQHIIVSQVAKAVFWQPADVRLTRPIETLGVYVVGMASMLLAALALRKQTPRRPLIPTETDPQRLFWFALLATLFAAVRYILVARAGLDARPNQGQSGSGAGTISVLTNLGPLAVASATAYVLVSSRGRNSIGPLNLFAMALPTVFGFLTGARADTTLAFVAYAITCYSYRYKLRATHYAVFIGSAVFAQFILFPFLLYARHITRDHSRGIDYKIRATIALFLDVLADPIKAQEYGQQMSAAVPKGQRHLLYYGKQNPTLDRFSIITVADGAVDGLYKYGTTEMQTISPGLLMLAPRILFPDKPVGGAANTSAIVAHRIPGMLNKEDFTTGITIGFFADSFTAYAWAGIAVIPFLLLYAYTTMCRFLIGDKLWRNVPVISLIWLWPMDFSEHMIATVLLTIFQGPLVIGFSLLGLRGLVSLLEGLWARRRHSSDVKPMPLRLRIAPPVEGR